MKSKNRTKATTTKGTGWLKEQEEDKELAALLELLKKQFELDKKLHALLTITTGE